MPISITPSLKSEWTTIQPTSWFDSSSRIHNENTPCFAPAAKNSSVPNISPSDKFFSRSSKVAARVPLGKSDFTEEDDSSTDEEEVSSTLEDEPSSRSTFDELSSLPQAASIMDKAMAEVNTADFALKFIYTSFSA